jgi:hypothetical protein
MTPSILRDSCGETFRLAAIETLKRKMRVRSWSFKKKILYSFCLMVEASDHEYVLHTRRIHVTRYNVVRVGYIYLFFERVSMYNNAKRTRGKLQRFISTVLQFPATRYASAWQRPFPATRYARA